MKNIIVAATVTSAVLASPVSFAEEKATIDAMLADEPEDNKSAQCRFPARKLWLSQVLPGI
ncbi:hypothetical protein BIT28_23950 [Photobacterium proteolyticum]|uniref:DUF7843 domain-containing protein n=1 Tax=Photobacterium proteolyticum TaxID=1903952 RepID=A0A1Q9GBJ5_9GAMM|nr:hypothetical protein [Photobacterium proteolyticum]OLQ71717.1 hypothetical protein BIT28_23950 [Photobacterium proteolyticum]